MVCPIGRQQKPFVDVLIGNMRWAELTDPGFDHRVLSEFRSRLINGRAEAQLLKSGGFPDTPHHKRDGGPKRNARGIGKP